MTTGQILALSLLVFTVYVASGGTNPKAIGLWGLISVILLYIAS